jgi:dynein heavy chain
MQLSDWALELQVPKSVWLAGLFNPTAFLTAVMQAVALAWSYDLDAMFLTTEVLRKGPHQIEAPAREGAYVHGLFMEGARWDLAHGCIEDSRIKELYICMPVLLMRAVPTAKADLKDLYSCPVYKTQQRGHGYVCTCWLRTHQPTRKWVIAGVAMLLDVVEI